VVGVVAHQDGDVDRQLALPPAVQQVVHAVGLLGGQQPHPRSLVREPQRRSHAEALGERRERPRDVLPRQVEPVQLELHPQEERLVRLVGVLLQVDDVAPVPRHERGGRGDDPRLVGTRRQQSRGRSGRHAAQPPTARDAGERL
jgi:hypothetical protein